MSHPTRKSSLASPSLVATPLVAHSAAPAPASPPRAKVVPHSVDSPHGSRVDPYYWLRDDEREDPEVLAYLEAENDYLAQEFAPLRPLENALFDEIVGRIKQDDASVPYRKNGYWYYTRFEVGKEHPIFARRPAEPVDAAEQILLDANALAAGHDYYEVGALAVSPDSTTLAFCEDIVGRREYRLRFRDLATGAIDAVAIAPVEPDLAWANDSRTVLYVEKDRDTLLGLYVKKHVRGTDPAGDVLVFQQTDKSFYTNVAKSKSERYLFILMESTVASEWHYADADDPALEFHLFLGHERDHEYQLEHWRDRFIVRTNWRADNFRLMLADIAPQTQRESWVDLVPHSDTQFIDDFDVFATFLAVSVRQGGLKKISVQPLPGWDGAEFFIASDEAAYTMGISVNPELDTTLIRYTYSSLTTPKTVYDYDVHTGVRTLLKRDPVLGTFDPADYRTEFLFVNARDGATIPVSLVYRADTPRDGTAPMLQYAYGAYGISMDPGFSASRLSLLDRGFVYAIAHVRGGQELGRHWYDAGRLAFKMNSFTDFIDVTHALVARGVAARDKVFAMGGSAGGLLVAAAANLAPQDYRAIVAQVPFVDVVTTMLDDSIPLTTNEYDEWGDPRDPGLYAYMLSYSPYDNVRRQAYPAMLVTTGLWDSQVQYYEPAKWVAKLRALKTDGNVLLLHTDMEAGHGGKSGRFQRYREIAMEYAFILARLDRG
jgi:oligopeptidase B